MRYYFEVIGPDGPVNPDGDLLGSFEEAVTVARANRTHNQDRLWIEVVWSDMTSAMCAYGPEYNWFEPKVPDYG